MKLVKVNTHILHYYKIKIKRYNNNLNYFKKENNGEVK